MKFLSCIFITALLFLAVPVTAQSNEFVTEWQFIENKTGQLDTMVTFVRKERQRFNAKKHKLKLYSRHDMAFKHVVRVSYHNGHIYTVHKYRHKRNFKAKIFLVDGQRTMIKAKYLKNPGGNVKQKFSKTGPDTWHWTHPSKEDAFLRSREIISNWKE